MSDYWSERDKARSRGAVRARQRRHAELKGRIDGLLDWARQVDMVRPPGLEFGTKAAGDRTLSGYANVFGVADYQGDIVLPGAFDRWLRWYRRQTEALPLLEEHTDPEKNPAALLGYADEIKVDDYGLYASFRLLAGDVGERVVRLVRGGKADGLSIGYRADDWRAPTWEEKEHGARRTLTGVWVREISLVKYPANSPSRVTATKSASELLIERVRTGLAAQRAPEAMEAQAELRTRIAFALARAREVTSWHDEL